jgi:hypothetical protein
MQMMQAFDVGWEATTILWTDLHLIMPQSGSFRFLLWHNDTAV